MYTLYGTDESGSCMIEIALQRCAVPWHRVQASSWQDGEGSDALARINPLKQIPTLVTPNGQVLTESAAILIHLGLLHPESGLLPAEPLRRAQAIRGLVYIAANCYSAISVIDYPERYTTDTGEAARKAVRAGARARLHHHWSLFADQFAAYPFLSGDTPGALDYLAAVVSKWSGTRAHLRELRPEFHATLERIERDPQVAAVFARHWPAQR